ncbi:MAG: hypothetical protein ACOX9R_06025 [Armatimonadota bacterium]
MKWLGRRHRWLVILGTVVALVTSGALLLMPAESEIWWPATGGAVEQYDLQFSNGEMTARYTVLFGSAAAGLLGGVLAIVAAMRAGFGAARLPAAFIGAILIALHLLALLAHLAITS